MLTLHSGMTPSFVRVAPGWIRRGIRLTCLFYGQVVCVNQEIAGAISSLGIDADKLRIAPAFLPFEAPVIPVPPDIEGWLNQHSPVIATTMFFRPEYGFELLVETVERLRVRYPKVGCLVMGSGENRDEASALLMSRGLMEAMFLAGDLDHDICLALMSRSDVFVRPTFRDGDSISVREAVALNVPVVASNVGTRPENVFLFEPGDVNGLTTQLERALLVHAGGVTGE
jgi:glycosyltransferase involved in cell wall biosynthesis